MRRLEGSGASHSCVGLAEGMRERRREQIERQRTDSGRTDRKERFEGERGDCQAHTQHGGLAWGDHMRCQGPGLGECCDKRPIARAEGMRKDTSGMEWGGVGLIVVVCASLRLDYIGSLGISQRLLQA